MTNVSAMSLTQLALIVHGLPDRPVLWTDFEREASAEYDARVLALEAKKAS